jgi:hypothetical protein
MTKSSQERKTGERRWAKPDANGVYWWRYDQTYAPEIVEVRDGLFYSVAEPDPTSVSVGEFFGPITPESFSSHADLERERDVLARHLRATAALLKETAFSYHVEAKHKPAFANCANVLCSQACFTWNKLAEKYTPPEGER